MKVATPDAQNGIFTFAMVRRQPRMSRRSWTHATKRRKTPETRTYRCISPPFVRPSSTIASGKSGALFVRRRDDPSNRRDHEVRLVELNVMTAVRQMRGL